MPYTTKSQLKIYFETAGDPKNPALLMNHGLGNCVKNWHQLGYVDTLAKHFYLIMYDGRGFGLSEKPHDAKSYQHHLLVEDVIAVLDALNIKKCHCFGNSRGGNIAISLLVNKSERFLSFTIAGTNLYGGNIAAGFLSIIQAAIETSPNQFIQSLELLLGKPFPAVMRDDYKNNDLLALKAATEMMTWENYSDVIKNSRVPCMFFIAEQDAHCASVEKFCASYPGKFTFTVMKNMSHAEAYWNGKLAATLLIEFVFFDTQHANRQC